MSPADIIRASLDEMATVITDRHFAAHPELTQRYGAVGRQRCLEDARFHLQYLAMTIEAGNDTLFLDYIGWTKVLLVSRNVSESDLVANLTILADVVEDDEARRIVRAAIDALPAMSAETASMLDPRAPLWNVASEYLSALLGGNRRTAQQTITLALDQGASLREIYLHVFQPAQQEIGRLWQLNEITVAQEHFCTAATQQIMAQLYGRMFGSVSDGRRAVAMCVGSELHEIGLRIVTDLLELDGWQTWYLGASVPPAAAVQLCADHKADALLVSATLPPHIVSVREVVRTVRARAELDSMRVIVGGRAFRTAPDLWRTIGADGFASSYDDCIELLDRLIPA